VLIGAVHSWDTFKVRVIPIFQGIFVKELRINPSSLNDGSATAKTSFALCNFFWLKMEDMKLKVIYVNGFIVLKIPSTCPCKLWSRPWGQRLVDT